MVSQLFKEINQFISGHLPLFLWPSLPPSAWPGISPSPLWEELRPSLEEVLQEEGRSPCPHGVCTGCCSPGPCWQSKCCSGRAQGTPPQLTKAQVSFAPGAAKELGSRVSGKQSLLQTRAGQQLWELNLQSKPCPDWMRAGSEALQSCTEGLWRKLQAAECSFLLPGSCLRARACPLHRQCVPRSLLLMVIAPVRPHPPPAHRDGRGARPSSTLQAEQAPSLKYFKAFFSLGRK